MNFLIKIIDYQYHKKKYSFLRNEIKNINVFFDIGAHHGETVRDFLKNFSIDKIYSFEPSNNNFDKLKCKIKDIKKKYPLVNIEIFNCGLGQKNETLSLNEISDGESNTFNDLNLESKYFKRKKVITTLFGIKKFFRSKTSTNVITLKKFIQENQIEKIDFIKIDTEGFEYNVLLGLDDYIENVSFILFEHHYDNMIIKNYKFSDIHKLLVNNGFERIYKTKMPFRKSFDYIYKKKLI